MIVPRAHARTQGLKRYFTGQPCKRGHVAERMTSTKTCVECKAATERIRVRDWATHYARHKPRLLREKLRWQKENPGKAAAATARRRAGEERATPRWLSVEDRKLIEFMYEEAASFSEYTGVKFHVDHIVPLRGKTVSGLHVPWNLRMIAASKNIAKGNKLQVV